MDFAVFYAAGEPGGSPATTRTTARRPPQAWTDSGGDGDVMSIFDTPEYDDDGNVVLQERSTGCRSSCSRRA